MIPLSDDDQFDAIPYVIIAAYKIGYLVAVSLLAFGALPANAQIPSESTNFLAAGSRAYGTRAETEPPHYVRRVSDLGHPYASDLGWMLLGADYRARYEVRNHDYRYNVQSNDSLLLRARLYFGVEKLLDPLRFGIELQDSRLVLSHVADNARDVDKYDVLQAYAELYGKNLYGEGQPVRLQYGRIAFEYLDRRLLSRNPWRNTANNFQGFRLSNGNKDGVAWLDVLALKPITIDPESRDRVDGSRELYGVIGSYSGWSQFATIQPYVLRSVDDEADSALTNWGLRAYASFESGVDYDVVLNLQAGSRDDSRRYTAEAAAIEVGYSVDSLPWMPRFSGFLGYASGSTDTDQDGIGRFDRLFGFSRPWSASDYVIFENVVVPKARVEMKPGGTIRLEASYSAFWLASDTDVWKSVGRRDLSGQSGQMMGQEIEGSVRFKAGPHLEVLGGYAHFFPGQFARETGPSPDSDFVYLELNFQLFK